MLLGGQLYHVVGWPALPCCGVANFTMLWGGQLYHVVDELLLYFLEPWSYPSCHLESSIKEGKKCIASLLQQ
jgi:hypothetical protein